MGYRQVVLASAHLVHCHRILLETAVRDSVGTR